MKTKHLPIALSILTWLTALIITWFDHTYTFRWITFTLYCISISIPIILFISSHQKTIINHTRQLFQNRLDAISIIFLLLLTLTIHLIFLKSYPFTPMIDELRDGGLSATQILNGQMPNIFIPYGSHGLLIAAFTSLFYPIAENTVFTYRLPAALIAISSSIAFYTLLFTTLGKRHAFWGTLILITLPLHLYFGRTEIVIALNSFFTILLLTGLIAYQKSKIVPNTLFLATTIGITLHLHSSLLPVAFLTTLILITETGKNLINSLKQKKKTSTKHSAKNFLSPLSKQLLLITLIIVFILIGIGPKLLYIQAPSDITDRIIFLKGDSHFVELNYKKPESLAEYAESLKKRYSTSFLAWIYEPVTHHYPAKSPLLPPLLSIFFALGIASIILIPSSRFAKILILFALVLPLTNSALTEALNNDHRLAPLLPIGAAITSIGIVHILPKIKNRSWQEFASLLIIYYLLIFQVLPFFVKEPANQRQKLENYLTMHTIYAIQENATIKEPNHLCITGSPEFTNEQQLLHTREYYDYFLPNHTFSYQIDHTIPPDTVLITPKTCPSQPLNTTNYTPIREIPCTPTTAFICPYNFTGTLTISHSKI